MPCVSNKCRSGRDPCPTTSKCFGPLTEADLDRHIAGKADPLPLPELLLAKGAMTGPHKRRGPITRWSRFMRRLVANVTYIFHN